MIFLLLLQFFQRTSCTTVTGIVEGGERPPDPIADIGDRERQDKDDDDGLGHAVLKIFCVHSPLE